MKGLRLKPQEIPFSHSDSNCTFQPSEQKPFVATPAAIDAFGVPVITGCLRVLQDQARMHEGLDYLQVFENSATGHTLWFIEDGDGGAITALLPSDY
jgi:hypothetical protein